LYNHGEHLLRCGFRRLQQADLFQLNTSVLTLLGAENTRYVGEKCVTCNV